MILPNNLTIGLWFAAVPIWQWEPVEPPCDGTDPPPDDGLADAPVTAPDAAAPPPDDPAVKSGQWVFKGYEWRPTMAWDTFANSAWDRWADAKREDSGDRALRDARARDAAARGTLPPAAAGTPPEEGVAPKTDWGQS